MFLGMWEVIDIIFESVVVFVVRVELIMFWL